MRLAALALFALACSGERTFEAPVELAGERVEPEVLNHGEFVYMRDCRGCHGQSGRGDGTYASSLAVRPADLTRGEYPRLAPGGLPSDAVLERAIREGIAGTPMVPMGMSDADRRAVVHYVKTLAPIWREERAAQLVQ
jgi:mono/diheme cytochrome c family protein